MNDFNQEFVAERMGEDAFDEMLNLSVEGVSDALKRAVLYHAPDIVKCLIYMAKGEAEYECEHCELPNKVSTGKGSFQAAKYLLEQSARWIPMIKTLNMSLSAQVEIPKDVLTSPSQRSVDLAIVEEMLLLNPDIKDDEWLELLHAARERRKMLT